MFGFLMIFQQGLFPVNAIFPVPKHHESPYMDEKYTIPLENNFNLTQNETFTEKLSHLHRLATSLVGTFNNRSIRQFSDTQLNEIQNNMNTLHHKLDELHVKGNQEDGLQFSDNSTKQLYLDTVFAVIKYNEIVTKLL